MKMIHVVCIFLFAFSNETKLFEVVYIIRYFFFNYKWMKPLEETKCTGMLFFSKLLSLNPYSFLCFGSVRPIIWLLRIFILKHFSLQSYREFQGKILFNVIIISQFNFICSFSTKTFDILIQKLIKILCTRLKSEWLRVSFIDEIHHDQIDPKKVKFTSQSLKGYFHVSVKRTYSSKSYFYSLLLLNFSHLSLIPVD